MTAIFGIAQSVPGMTGSNVSLTAAAFALVVSTKSHTTLLVSESDLGTVAGNGGPVSPDFNLNGAAMSFGHHPLNRFPAERSGTSRLTWRIDHSPVEATPRQFLAPPPLRYSAAVWLHSLRVGEEFRANPQYKLVILPIRQIRQRQQTKPPPLYLSTSVHQDRTQSTGR